MNEHRKKRTSSRWVFVFLIVICIAGIVFSSLGAAGVISGLASTILSPMQAGINRIGSALRSFSDSRQTIAELKEENQNLQEEIDQLNSDLTAAKENYSEYEDLLSLLELKEKYPNYDMTGARIISKDSGNWYDTFTINKGSADGIKEDMNVIADGGLVGIVTEVNPNTSIVRSIIDDRSSVSAMLSKNYNNCFVDGDLTLIDSGMLKVDMLSTDSGAVEGDEVVTSYISDKFLPGILIGYITELETDDNNLTYTAKLTPVVDFSKLSNVMVIKQLKQDITQGSSSDEESTETQETQTETTSAESSAQP